MDKKLVTDAVLKVGNVTAVEGRKIYVEVDKNKNASDLLLDGQVIKNISVGSYIEIRKGFLSLIGKIDGEKLKTEIKDNGTHREIENENNKRILAISLNGYIDRGKFTGGVRELPLIGNEAYILTKEKITNIHRLKSKEGKDLFIDIASTEAENYPISLPVDGLFNSHIAIFGNTGSGKSNTLASLYTGLFKILNQHFISHAAKFLFFDFNGEYTKESCLTNNKKVYQLSTSTDGDRLPISFEQLFDLETMSILVEATEKTQKPFLKRALRTYRNAKSKAHFYQYTKVIIQNKIKDVLRLSNKDTAFRLLEYLEFIISRFSELDENYDFREGLDFHNQASQFTFNGTFISLADEQTIQQTKYFLALEQSNPDIQDISEFDQFLIYLHIQLIDDLRRYKVQNDHIYPVITRILSRKPDLEKIFDITNDPNVWEEKNVIVIGLREVNMDMKKTIPLLLAKEMYSRHKQDQAKFFNIIIDEAHNILSKTSFRETNEWKDYRLETFEEIIKEGRKFGVFLTISSQRPNDISETIISQAHNYFIHQLINQRDLQTIGNAVSYIDKITEESIPTLPVGTCIFSGMATSMPLKLVIHELEHDARPDSATMRYSDITPDFMS